MTRNHAPLPWPSARCLRKPTEEWMHSGARRTRCAGRCVRPAQLRFAQGEYEARASACGGEIARHSRVGMHATTGGLPTTDRPPDSSGVCAAAATAGDRAANIPHSGPTAECLDPVFAGGYNSPSDYPMPFGAPMKGEP